MRHVFLVSCALLVLHGLQPVSARANATLQPLATSDDSAPEINAAIKAMCAANGGTLSLAAGVFHIKTPISVPCALRIEGEGWSEAPQGHDLKGTWLSVEQTSTPALSFVSGSKGASIEEVAFIEPAQPLPSRTKPDWTPLSMPAAISIIDVGGFTYIHNIYMHGVSRGIESQNGGRTTINGLYGQFFQNAITLDAEMDISRISNVHSWPYFSGDKAVIDYQQKHLRTIVLGRADGAFIDTMFAYAAQTGISFIKGRGGDVATGIQIGSIECDSVQHCLHVEANGVTMMINQMRQFGQAGISSGRPLQGADAILVTGQASIMLNQVEARLIDSSAITIENPSKCSNVRIAQAFVDFSHSTSARHDLRHAISCGPNGQANDILFGMPPAFIP